VDRGLDNRLPAECARLCLLKDEFVAIKVGAAATPSRRSIMSKPFI
jgi:hypothetical protein